MRVVWPVDVVSRRFIAPNDLQIGHVLEVADVDGGRCVGWVADADARRFVLVPARDGPSAVSATARALELWRAAELVAVAGEWQSRIEVVWPSS